MPSTGHWGHWYRVVKVSNFFRSKKVEILMVLAVWRHREVTDCCQIQLGLSSLSVWTGVGSTARSRMPPRRNLLVQNLAAFGRSTLPDSAP